MSDMKKWLILCSRKHDYVWSNQDRITAKPQSNIKKKLP